MKNREITEESHRECLIPGNYSHAESYTHEQVMALVDAANYAWQCLPDDPVYHPTDTEAGAKLWEALIPFTAPASTAK